MKGWFTLVVAACIAGAAQAFLEDFDRHIEEQERDPVKKQIAQFNEYAVRCFGDARKNQSLIRMEQTESACCLRDFWMDCMKQVPLIKECSSLTENQLKKFEEDLVTGFDCSNVDIRTCVHSEGHENFVSANKERSARFTSAAPSQEAPALIALIAVTMSVITRLL